MGVRKYRDRTGALNYQIISGQYRALRSLEVEYQKIGKRTWFNMWDMCSGQFVLTVRMEDLCLS